MTIKKNAQKRYLIAMNSVGNWNYWKEKSSHFVRNFDEKRQKKSDSNESLLKILKSRN